MLPRACRSVAALSMVMGLAAASHADDWGTVVAISSTMGVHGDRVCVGEETRGDIGCPTYAPEVMTDGTVSATRFAGDGSGLTGVTVSPSDRLVSGSAALILSSTGVLNLTGRLELNSGTGVVGIGTNAAASSKGDYVVGIGTSAAQNNSGTYVNALGLSAAAYNSGANVAAIGTYAAQYNSGSHVNALGVSAARNNNGNFVDAIGFSAAQYNSGSSVMAIGREAAQFNTGGHVTALGYYAARNNSGMAVNAFGENSAQFNRNSYVNALGLSAAQYNSGSYVNALGYYAAYQNTGGSVNALGSSAAYQNSGGNVNAMGNSAAYANTGGEVNALGYVAAQNNTGSYVNAIGSYAARSNSGTNVNAFGRETARDNRGNNVNALGYNAASSNTGHSVEAVGYDAARFNSGTNVIGIGSYAGQNNTGNNVVALGSLAARNNTFINVVALGYNAQPDKANQIVLGDSSIVEVSTAGVILARGVSTTGTVTATRFVGDGSGLTGVVASTADRIVSGTTSMVAVSSTGFVSLTQAGTNTGWFDPTRGLVTLGVSATGTVSGTKAYFNGNVGIGTVAPSSYALIVSGSAVGIGGVGLRMFGGDPADSNLTKLSFHPSNFSATSQYWAGILYSNANGWMSIGGGGGNVLNLYFDSGDGSSHIFRKVGWNGSARTSSEAMRLDGASNLGIGTSTPKARLHVAGAALVTSWTGINFSSANVTPTAPLEVSGTVSATRFVGDGSGLTGVVASTADRIVSGTTSMVAVSSSGFVSLTQAGTNTGWFDPTRGLVTLGVSATGGISATTGYFTNGLNVGGRIDLVSGTSMVAVGLNAGQANTGSYVNAFGLSAGQFNGGHQVEAMGAYAAQYNSGSGVVAMGANAGRYNGGSAVHALGTGAARYNSGSGVNALGQNAAQFNRNSYVNAFGTSAAEYNSGSYVNALGHVAAEYNYGSNINALGYLSARGNTGSNVNAFGYVAGQNNTGNHVNNYGYSAGTYNTGSYLNALGQQAAEYNSASHVNALGYLSGQYNTGSYVDAMGARAANSNTGSDVVAIGRNAAISNTFSNVVALGYDAQPDKANQVVLGNASIVEVSTAGVIMARGVSTTGTVTATRFVGDGSGLTGVVASTADRIVSGTTSMVAVSSTGFVSLTQAGTNTGWFDPTRGLVTLGVSATGGISATTGYFTGNVSASTVVAGEGSASYSYLTPLTLRGGGNLPRIRFTYNAWDAFIGNASLMFNGTSTTDFGIINQGGVYRLLLGTANNRPSLIIAGNGNVGVMTSLTTPAATLHVSGTVRMTSWTMVNANVTPTAPLEVSGTVSATRFVGDGSGLTGVVASTADRIVSGTTSLLAVSGTGFVSLTQAGTNTGWFDPARGLVTLGVSATGGISATTGYMGNLNVANNALVLNRLGVGSSTTPAYAYALDVVGSGRFYNPSADTSVDIGRQGDGIAYNALNIWSAYNATWPTWVMNQGFAGAVLYTSHHTMMLRVGSSPAAPSVMNLLSTQRVGISNTNPQATLDVGGNVIVSSSAAAAVNVYGTVSATRFVGDGSGLTGLNASTDRLVSGSAALILSSTGVLNLTGRLELNSGTGVVGIGNNAAASSKGDYVVGIGSGAAQTNSSSSVNALGLNAARLNNGTAVNALGYYSAYQNTGGSVNALGSSAAYQNTGGNVNAIGNSAAFANTGSDVNALGYVAAQYNSGANVNALGYLAARYNRGGNVVAAGFTSAENNTGSYVTAIGSYAARFNSGTHVNASGYFAATNNAGSYLNALGQQAAEYNSASHVNALGYLSGQYNTGNYVDAMGARAANSNTGSDVVAIGRYAAISNTFSNVVALGYDAQPDKANQVVLGNASIVEVSTAGVIMARGVSATGTVTATRFVGDGSGLTGLNASTDRLVSGTSGITAYQDSSLTFSTGGSQRMTIGQNGNIGIGNFSTLAPQAEFHVSSTRTSGYAPFFLFEAGKSPGQSGSVEFRRPLLAQQNLFSFHTGASDNADAFIGTMGGKADALYVLLGNGTSTAFGFDLSDGLRIGLASNIVSGRPNAILTPRGSAFFGGNAGAPSATLHVSGSARVTSWTMVNADISATAPLEVSGTVSATYVKLADNDNLPCTAASKGTLRFSNGIVSICRAQ